MVTLIRCPYCGHENPPDSLFCENCGAKLYPQGPPPEGVGPLGPPQTPPELPPPAAFLELPDGSRIPVDSPTKVVGRGDVAGSLPPGVDPLIISRRHFVIYSEPGGYTIEDVSTNGTSVNGVDIRGKGRVPLRDGDSISMAGAITLVFRAGRA